MRPNVNGRRSCGGAGTVNAGTIRQQRAHAVAQARYAAQYAALLKQQQMMRQDPQYHLQQLQQQSAFSQHMASQAKRQASAARAAVAGHSYHEAHRQCFASVAAGVGSGSAWPAAARAARADAGREGLPFGRSWR